MKWFKKHPKHLESEVKELESNSNYEAKHTSRDNLLVSCGEIVVRLKKTLKYPVLIVYPDSTPYTLPKVYLLDRLFSKEEVNDISRLPYLQVDKYLRDKIKFYYRRHQGADGSLCLVQMDNLYLERAQIYPVRQVIGRVRDWFAGFNTGRLPPDSPEVELFYHFSNQNKEVEFLLPEFLFDGTLNEGVFYGARLPTPPEIKRIYIGVTIFGKNALGLFEPPKEYDNKQHLLFTEAPELSQIQKYETERDKDENIIQKLRSGKLVRVCWFEITSEPQPFETVEQLVLYVGNGDKDAGKSRLVEWLNNEFRECEHREYPLIYVGLRFPARKVGKELQVFALRKREGSPYLLEDNLEAKVEMLNNYDIEAVRSEAFTDQSYHLRNSARANRSILRSKKVTVIGCGALGSEIADALAKAGVGQIQLADKEMFRAHNAVRHIVSIDRMGCPKVTAVAERLILHNTFVDVGLQLVDILDRNINEYFLEESVGISTMADDNVEGYLNEQAIIYDKTIFYARALRGGKAARIFRVIPGKDACKHCLALYYLDKDKRFVQITEDETLPTIANECNNPIRPASAADLKVIAAVTSRLIIDYLQGGEEDSNHWIWTTEALEGIKYEKQAPFVLHSSFLPPHLDCEYCRREGPVKVIITEEALKIMQDEISKNPALETGGILIGYREQLGNVVITLASEPGPKAIKKKTRFIRDTEYCQKIVHESYRECGNKGLYLGEWHYHPYPDNRPSNIDLLSLTAIAEQKEYVLDKPVMIIFSNKGELSCTVHPFNKKYYFAEFSTKETKC